ncbi:MAG: hypothetical protein RJA36_1021 [Pseudomonadota bacterium]|jgi:PAS domain S-box-containing protein
MSTTRFKPANVRRLLALCLCGASLLAHAAPPAAVPGSDIKVLRVVSGDDFPPYLFRDSDGKLQGYLVDYWQLWERKTGVMVKLDTMPWDEAHRRIQRGDADVINMLYRTLQREQLYDFSPPVALGTVNIYSHVSISGTHNAQTLKGFQVGVLKGHICNDKLAEQGITSLLRYDRQADLFNAVQRGEIRIFCIGGEAANFYLYRLGIADQFRKAFELYAGAGYHVVLKGNAGTLALVVRGMQAITPAETDALRRKWLGTPLDEDRAAILRIVGLGGGILVGIALLLGAWVWTTRRAVRHKTAELAESEERFRALFEDTRQAIVLIEDRCIVAANRAALDMLCMQSLDELLGKTVEQLSPPLQPDGSDSVEKAEEMNRITRERGFHQFEWMHRRADGETFPAQVLLTAIRRGGKVLMHAVWNDITAQKQAERELAEYRQGLERQVAERTAELAAASERLRSANAQLSVLFEAAPVGLAHTSQGRITAVNRRFTELFGYDENDIPTTQAWWPLAYPDPGYREWVQQTWQVAKERALKDDGEIEAKEYRVRNRNGQELYLLIGGQLIEDGSITTFTDISALKQTEAELKRAKQAAEDAARAKASFLANMSHEIRTPMNAVIGMTQLALKADPPPRVRDYLSKIQSSSQLLLGVINDILDVSKIEANKMRLDRVGFALDRLLEDVAELVAEKASGKGLELIVSAAPDVPVALLGDPLRLQQVLLNLANNAVKFTERGEVEIRVRLQQRLADGVELRFEVRDTGIGISAEQRGKLFQSFQQADSSTTRLYGGTGLGLTIAKRLAELMGGQIGLDSMPGQGSTFWFTARLGLDAKRPPLQRRPPAPGRLKVLLVDDNAQARAVVAELITRLGFQAATAASGAEALAEIAQADATGQPYDIALLDWKMPGMDGLELARAIRQRPLRQAPLLLMVTAHDRDAVVPLAQQAGIAEVLVKPITPSTLLDALMRQSGGKADPIGSGPKSPDALHAFAELTGARALLVEDNELNQEVATEFLHTLGLAVDLAPNGAVALDKVRQQAYDIVLMDMQMPVMDGLSATRAIRQLPGRQTLPILAMTANAMAEDRERCIEAGMNDHIAKPIDVQELVDKLKRWVRPPSAPGPAPAAARPAPPTAEPDWITAMTGIDGLDARQGLRQVLGREALYREILARFTAGQRDTPDAIARALDAGQRDEARRLAHTLKGLAAQIGALSLREQAARLEAALRDGTPEPAPLLAAIASDLPRLVDAISARLPQSCEPRAGVSFEPAQWQGLRECLLELLRQDDTSCMALLDEQQALARAALGPRFQAFADQVAGFDFAAALALLEAAP